MRVNSSTRSQHPPRAEAIKVEISDSISTGGDIGRKAINRKAQALSQTKALELLSLNDKETAP